MVKLILAEPTVPLHAVRGIEVTAGAVMGGASLGKMIHYGMRITHELTVNEAVELMEDLGEALAAVRKYPPR